MRRETQDSDSSRSSMRVSALPNAFKIVLVGESFSLFGTQIAAVMVPLIAVLSLNAGEFALGLVSAFTWLPIVLFGLVAGTCVDRTSRWLVMVTCNVLRACLIALIPTLALLDALSITALLAVSFGVGICNVFFDIAYQTYIPEIVPSASLGTANSALEFVRSVAQLAGPLLGGLLASMYRPEFVVTINSVTFMIAFFGLLLIPARFRIPHRVLATHAGASRDGKQDTFLRDVLDGLHLVWRSHEIRLVVISGALVNVFGAGVEALFALFVTRTLGLGSSVYGFVVAIAGLGALAGALTYRYWSDRLREGACVAVGLASLAAGTLLVVASASTPFPVAMLILGQALMGYGSPIMNIALVTLRQRLTPPDLLGRVNASARVAIMSSLPLGALLVSALAERTSTPVALWAAALGEVAVLLVLGPLLLRLKGPTVER